MSAPMKPADVWEQWTEWPDWAKDALVTDTEVHVSLADALRVLWHRRFLVTAKTFVPVVIEKTQTLSRFSVLPIFPRRPVGMVSAAQEAPPK